MVGSVEYMMDCIATQEKRSRKCDEILSAQKEQLAKVKDRWHKVVKLARYYKVLPSKKDQESLQREEMFRELSRTLEKSEKDREGLMKRATIRERDMARHARQMQARVDQVRSEIEGKTEFLRRQQEAVQELIEGLRSVGRSNEVVDAYSPLW